MPEYQRSQDVDATSERLFEFLSQIGNLPRYFPGMTSAEPGDVPGEVDVTADVHGKPVAGTARFHVDETRNRIDWSSEGPNSYRGWLQVTGTANRSVVEVHITTDRSAAEREIEAGLERTLGEIRHLVQEGVAAG